MKLVTLYGPPGVGKLTTASALAELTGFKLFHNHLTFDLVRSLFDFPSAPFGKLAERIRLSAFEAAAEAGLSGVIFTLVYAAPEDDAFMQKMIDAVERRGGELLFVRLQCDAATHEERVRAPERERYGKIVGARSLREAMARWNLSSRIPMRESLEIDNSSLSAEAVARRIADHFRLAR
ncbi:MAG TPA: AAA family ATPase [Burkholderiales bacterium]